MFGIKKSESKGVNYIKEKYGVTPQPLESYDSGSEALFSIYDKVCEEYNPPFVCKNMQLAKRTLQDSFKGKNTLLTAHPEDYELVLIGYFDKSTGSIAPNLNEKVDGVTYLPIVDILKEVKVYDEIQK